VVDVVASACDTYTWALNHTTYTQSGNYTVQTGQCENTILHLTINHGQTFNVYHSMCNGEVYQWHGQTVTATGVYTATEINANGCEDSYVLHLTVNPTYAFVESQTIGFGGSYTWHGQTYNTSGTYYAHYLTVHGCDSTYTLHLTVSNVAPVVFNCTTDKVETSCQTQAAINAKFATWLASTTASGGLNGVLTNNATVAPSACGGFVDVTWTYANDINPLVSTCTKRFTVTPTDPVIIGSPLDANVSSCAFANQAALNADFATWKSQFTVTGGCTPLPNLSNYNAPVLCNGGTVTISFTINNPCGPTQSVSKYFKVTKPNPVVISSPANATVSACSYANQGALDAAFATWKGQFGVSGGCTALLQDLSGYHAPVLCDGGTVTISFTVVDLCQTVSVSKTFTVVKPSPLAITSPANLSASSCNYANQAALNAAFASWKNQFTVSGGCSPIVTNLAGYTAPILCDGGTVTINFTINDLCQNVIVTKTFTVIKPNPLVVNSPIDVNVNAITFTSQADLDANFATWKSQFTVSGGCTAYLPDLSSYSVPVLCNGGIVTINKTISDLCQSASILSTYTVNKPVVSAGSAIPAICQGGTTVALGGSLGGGLTSAIWNDGGAGGSFANNGGSTPGTVTYTAAGNAPATVTLTLSTNAGACGVITDSKTLTVNPTPTVDAGVVLPVVCQGVNTGALGGSFGGSATGAIWTASSAGGVFTNNTGSTPWTATYTPSATAVSPITLTLTTVGGSCGTVFASKLLTVNPASVGGTITLPAGITSVCYGTNSTLLTLSNNVGTILDWEYSTNGTTWFGLGNYSNTYTATNLTGTTHYRAVVQSGSCGIAYSATVTITVSTYTISGTVRYGNGANTPLNGVVVSLWRTIGDVFVASYPSTAGAYQFTGLFNDSYYLTVASAAGTWQTWGGVNNTDYLLAVKYAGNNALMLAKPPITRVATDVVTALGVVNILDANAIRAAYGTPANVSSIFNVPKWVFAGDAASPALTGIVVNCGSVIQNIVGSCAGDVDASYTPPSGNKSIMATPHVAVMNQGSIPVSKDIVIPVKAENNMTMGAISLILDFDVNNFEITSVTMPNQGLDAPYFVMNGNTVRIGWASLQPVSVLQGETVLNIHARTRGNASASLHFALNGDPLSEIADADANVIFDAALSIADMGGTVSNNMTSVYPNPATDVLNVEYVLDNAGSCLVELYNVQGALVNTSGKTYKDAGTYKEQFSTSDLPVGVYTVRIYTGSNVQNLKVVITK